MAYSGLSVVRQLLRGVCVVSVVPLFLAVTHWVAPPFVDEAIGRISVGISGLPPLISSDTLRHSGWPIFHPEGFHGPTFLARRVGGTGTWFEGWYYKLVTEDYHTYVAIPGVILGEDPHAFVMFINTRLEGDKRATYHRYNLTEVEATATSGNFRFAVGPNVFTATDAVLDLEVDGRRVAKGTIQLNNRVPWPSSVVHPTVMGWFAYIPGMECNHGVVGLDYTLTGTLEVQTPESAMMDTVQFARGRGYVEKDWGSQFPTTWIWLQTNHFDNIDGACFMMSIAAIPFPNDQLELMNFRGFLGGLWTGTTLHRFGTYTGACIERLSPNTTHVEVVVRDSEYQLHITVQQSDAVLLWAPTKQGIMRPFVREQLAATIHVKLVQRWGDKATVFDGTGRNAGVEVMGTLGKIETPA